MIILCDSYRDAAESFFRFFNFMNQYEPQSIVRVFKPANAIDTETFRYVFLSKEFSKIFPWIRAEVIDSDRFFEQIDELYHEEYMG